jgi:hypothetical protein
VNDHQKLAALLLRMIGSAIAALMFFSLAFYGITIAIGYSDATYGAVRLFANVLYGAAGLALVIWSKALGKLFGRALIDRFHALGCPGPA